MAEGLEEGQKAMQRLAPEIDASTAATLNNAGPEDPKSTVSSS